MDPTSYHALPDTISYSPVATQSSSLDASPIENLISMSPGGN